MGQEGTGGMSALCRRDARRGHLHGSQCLPCESRLSRAAYFAGKACAQPGLFPKATATFMPQLLQKMREFLSAKLTCSKRLEIGGKERPEKWESLVPGVRGLSLF